jgi:two-component sensor histidine kinase
MERDLTHAALDAVAFLTGAALAAMLGRMQLRVDRAAGRISGYLLLWGLGFIWTFGNFLRCALELAGASADAASVKFAETFAWSCTLVGPMVIGRLLQGGMGADSRAARVFLGFTVGVSLFNLALLLRAGLAHEWRIEASAYPATTFYIAMVLGGIALLIYGNRRRAQPQPRQSMPRWFAPVAFGFAAIHTTAILSSMQFPDMPRPLMTAASLIGRHWTIPWSVLIAVSLAQAHFADVVLKRSLWLMVCMLLATASSVWLIGAAPGLPLLAAVLTTAALMLITPWVIRAVAAIVDRGLLDRADYAQARQSLDLAFRRATRPEEIIDAALASVRATLHVDARWVEATRRLEIVAMHQARALLHEERAFLDSVGVQLEHRLEALALEAEQRALLLREERLRRLLTEAELKALRTQVDPHFLFNTLNTISALMHRDTEAADAMLERLSDLLRLTLDRVGTQHVSLKDELDFLRKYLEIEKTRFGERLQVHIEVDLDTLDAKVPNLVLQPLVENALRHGIGPKIGGGRVDIIARRDGDSLWLEVRDNGVGLTNDAFHKGVGLTNTRSRLEHLYGDRSRFECHTPAGGGLLVTVVIPFTAEGTAEALALGNERSDMESVA